MEDIKVSVLCLVYNHEKYIRDCLEGFVMQKTDFKYEVLIHDDASTDNSAAIIREFEEKYPDIIKPIYQTENQYSKGVKITREFQYPRARGKYLALCEGDDYWIDPYKLSKQVEYMDAHPDCTFCFTNGYIDDMANGAKRRDFIPFNRNDEKFFRNESRRYTLDDMHELTFVPTASFLYSRDVLMKALEHMNEKCPTADLRIRLYLTSYGYAYYINDKTCVYRQNVQGSAMSGWKKQDRKAKYIHSELIVNMITKLDRLTEGKHSEGLYKCNYPYVCALLYSSTGFKALQNPLYKKVYKSFTLSRKLKFTIKALTPDFLLKLIQKYKAQGRI